MKAETPTTQLRLAFLACTLAALVLAGGCGKKEEKAPVAAQPQPASVTSMIDETKRNAEALKAQSAGAAALPYSQLPGLLDQLASHMEARNQARQQGADTSQADTLIAGDVTQLEEIQNTIAASPSEGDKKPALDQLSGNLAKVLEIVRQGQELKAALKPAQGEGGTAPGSEMNASAPQDSFTQSDDTLAATADASNPANETTGGNTGSEMKAKSGKLAATQLPAEKLAAPSSANRCCSVVPNPTMTGRLGRIVVTFPDGVTTNARVGVSKGDKEATYGFGNKTFELLPGSYTVVISGKRVDNVTVQSGHDTKVKVGVLRVTTPGNTRIGVLDEDGKTELTYGFGNKIHGLPIGTVYVSVAGQQEAVTIQEGKITDF